MLLWQLLPKVKMFRLCRQNILIFTFATPVSRASAWTASGEASSQTLAGGLPVKQSFQSFQSFQSSQSFQSFQRLKIIHIFYNSRSANALLSGQRWEALAFLGMEAAPMERSAAATNAFLGCQENFFQILSIFLLHHLSHFPWKFHG